MSALAAVQLAPGCHVRRLGRVDYLATLGQMRSMTLARDDGSADEIWLLEHPPVYTAGLNARPEHFAKRSSIPLIDCDRGGQVTYHGPGQLIAYCLFDITRLGVGVRQMVNAMEQALIELLSGLGIAAHRVLGAPGVYVEQRKIAALGLRVRRGRCYHGLSLNIDMDLAPFNAIDPCGYRGLQVTQLRELGIAAGTDEIGETLSTLLRGHIYAGAHGR